MLDVQPPTGFLGTMLGSGEKIEPTKKLKRLMLICKYYYSKDTVLCSLSFSININSYHLDYNSSSLQNHVSLVLFYILYVEGNIVLFWLSKSRSYNQLCFYTIRNILPKFVSFHPCCDNLEQFPYNLCNVLYIWYFPRNKFHRRWNLIDLKRMILRY